MADKVNWGKIIPSVIVGIGLIWIAGKFQSCGNSDKVIEALYQEVQAAHQVELAKRLQNIKKLEAAQAATAVQYQVQLDQLAVVADAKVKALKWKSNDQLTKEKASAEDVKIEKKKVEDALGIMTVNRDNLKSAAETREKEIADERAKLKTEHEGALATLQGKLDTCEKARQYALDQGGRKTWITIGPAVMVHMQGGVARVSYGISIQIPIIQIKSPFKRF